MTCNLVSHRAQLLHTHTHTVLLFFGSGCGKPREAERRLRERKTDISPRPKNPNHAAHLGERRSRHKENLGGLPTSWTAISGFSNSRNEKRGSDAGETEPEKDPRVVLSLVREHAAVRDCPRLSQEHVSRVGRAERRQSKTPGGGGEPLAPADVRAPGPHLPRLRPSSDLWEMLEPIQVSVPPL